MASVSANGPLGVKLAPELRSELFDPSGWRDVLETFARTMRMGVALTDSEGHLLGACHNPQPVWSLARQARPESNGACSFCLLPQTPCAAVKDAIQKGEIVTVTDGVGVAHVAAPLLLDGSYVAALMAGQVFDRYPESLRLQRAAKEFGMPAHRMWQGAFGQNPGRRPPFHI